MRIECNDLRQVLSSLFGIDPVIIPVFVTTRLQADELTK